MPFLGCVMAYTGFSQPVYAYDNQASVSLSNAIVDDVYITSDVDNIQTAMPDGWDFNTIANAQFKDESIAAGNMSFAAAHTSVVHIKRRIEGAQDWTLLATIPISSAKDFEFIFYDRTARCGYTYQYSIVPIVDGYESSMQTGSIESKFKGLFILDADGGLHSVVKANIGSVTRHQAGQTVPLYGSRYPYYVRNGCTNYDGGNVTAAFVYFDKTTCTLDFEHAIRDTETAVEFLADGKAKIIKHEDGRMWVANIVGDIVSNKELGERFPTVTFDFEQIGANEDGELLRNCGLVPIPSGGSAHELQY